MGIRDELPAVLPGPATGPNISFSVAQKQLKGEDVVFHRKGAAVGETDGSAWSLFCVCDGHTGSEAAKFVEGRLWDVLSAKLPAGDPPASLGNKCTKWSESVQNAVVETFIELEQEFTRMHTTSGTTVTLVLICGWVCTIVNTGDSDAVLDTFSEVKMINVSHRLDDNPSEQERFRESGVELSRLTADLSGPIGGETGGLGPIRCWPGGLAVGRSIGDESAGKTVVPIPHIRQFFLPKHSTRLILASDGLWDVIDHKHAAMGIRRNSINTCADKLLTCAIYQSGWAFADDTSIMVVELVPPGEDDFYQLGKKIRKQKKQSSGLRKLFSCAFPSQGQFEEKLGTAKIEMIADVDGLEVKNRVEEVAKPLKNCFALHDSDRELFLRNPIDVGNRESREKSGKSTTSGLEWRLSQDSDEVIIAQS